MGPGNSLWDNCKVLDLLLYLQIKLPTIKNRNRTERQMTGGTEVPYVGSSIKIFKSSQDHFQILGSF